MMRVWKQLRKFLRPLPLVMLISLALAAAVWFAGDRLGLRGVYPVATEPARFWVALALLLLGAILAAVLVFRAWSDWRAARAAEGARPPTPEEVETRAMAQIFDRVAGVIRARWSGEGNALYALPWYLVLGAKGSGKTALIENSDLRLPIDHEIRAALADLQGHEAARLADWRVAGNEAVLIELSGAAFIRHEDRTPMQALLWRRFLAGLQTLRPRRPLNGVVLTIDLLDFAEMDTPAREGFGLRLRRIIDDLVENLDTRMTVHVVFTKVDQIAGFLDFFENLTAAEREGLLGFHFAADSAQPWLDQFDAQYAEFLSRLHRQLNRRMNALKGTQSRQEAFTFVRSFVGLQRPLRSFLESALQPDKFSTPPLLRGIYLAAPRLENAPRNVFLEAVGERYHLPVPLYAVPQGASQPYFAQHLLKDVVFREAGLAGNSRRAEERYSRAATALAAGVALVAIGAGAYWLTQYRVNTARAQAVLARVEGYAAQQESGDVARNMLEPLNTIRDATFEFGDYRAVNPVVAQLTLYKGMEFGPLADTAYQTLLHRRFLPQLVAQVETDLADVCPRGSDQQLNLLRVVRMLGAPERRNIAAIETHFRTRWQAAFPGNAPVQDRLAEHLNYALTIDPAPYAVDAGLVKSAQSDLGRLTPYRRFYASIRALADRQLPNALEFRAAVGATFDIVYTAAPRPTVAAIELGGPRADGSTPDCAPPREVEAVADPFEIARLFTREQFHAFFVPQTQEVSRVALDDLWVLGISDKTERSEADLALVTDNLRELYVEDYIRAWRQGLNAMEVRPFRDLRDAGEILRGLSGADSPVRRIAALVADNTVIYPPETVTPDTSGGATELTFDPNREAGLRINEEFRAIHRMLAAEEGSGQPNIAQIEEALAALHDYVKIVRDAPSPNAKALEVAIARANLQGSDPIYVLQRLAERTPAPFDAHLRHVAHESWRVIMAAATEELNRKWHEEIYGDFQRLIAGRYPFDRASPDDLPLQDFEDFFGPGGTLESFYKTELTTFVDEATGQPRDIDGQSLPVDPDFAANLRRAINITRTFFNDSGDLSVEFSVQPTGMSANLSRAQLNFEGQVVISTHGAARPVRIIWPNIIDGQSSSRVDLSPLAKTGVPGGRQFDGPWSWLRLYDSASKSGLVDNSVDVGFGNANGQTARFRIRAEGQVNPFFNSPLSAFSLPSHLRRPGAGQ